VAELTRAITQYGSRGSLVELALAAFYLAIGCFVATSIALALSAVANNTRLWLPAWLTIAGAVLLFIGTAVLFAENRIANRMLREEIAQALEGA
jgi:protein-S-isoprenylcysteine O-methyltransferase Ste14